MAVFIKVWMVFFNNLLLLLCSGLVSDHIYHITPGLSDPCPAKLCLTLSQFARSPASVDTTLVILPGKHCLESKISIVNIGTFLMTSKYNESSIEITCHQSGGLTFTNVHSVHISGLDFFKCASNRVENVEKIILEDSHFFGQEDNTIVLSQMVQHWNCITLQ